MTEVKSPDFLGITDKKFNALSQHWQDLTLFQKMQHKGITMREISEWTNTPLDQVRDELYGKLRP